MKLLVIGRSGCGKDALRRSLESRGFRFVKSATTRPKRTENEDTHLFVDIDEMSRMLETAVAATEIDGFWYCTTADELDASDAYIIDPEGLFELCEKAPDNSYRVIYVRAPRDARLQAAVARADDPQDALDRFELRDSDEDARFSDFEKLLDAEHVSLPDAVSAWEIVDNDYVLATLEELADRLVIDLTFHQNMLRIIELAVSQSILPSEGGKVRLVMEDNTVRHVSLPKLADMLIGNSSDRDSFMRTLMSLVPISFQRDDSNALYTAEYDDGTAVESPVHVDIDTMEITSWGPRKIREEQLDALTDKLALVSETVEMNDSGKRYDVLPADNPGADETVEHGSIVWRR